jgi:hypothetical protein
VCVYRSSKLRISMIDLWTKNNAQPANQNGVIFDSACAEFSGASISRLNSRGFSFKHRSSSPARIKYINTRRKPVKNVENGHGQKECFRVVVSSSSTVEVFNFTIILLHFSCHQSSTYNTALMTRANSKSDNNRARPTACVSSESFYFTCVRNVRGNTKLFLYLCFYNSNQSCTDASCQHENCDLVHESEPEPSVFSKRSEQTTREREHN